MQVINIYITCTNYSHNVFPFQKYLVAPSLSLSPTRQVKVSLIIYHKNISHLSPPDLERGVRPGAGDGEYPQPDPGQRLEDVLGILFRRVRVVGAGKRLVRHREVQERAQRLPALAELHLQELVLRHHGSDPVVVVR